MILAFVFLCIGWLMGFVAAILFCVFAENNYNEAHHNLCRICATKIDTDDY